MKKIIIGLILCLPQLLAAHVGNVIVIGASAGIGREIARVFCAQGYKVGGISRREDALQELVQELGENNFLYRIGDVQEDACCDVAKKLITDMGGCDIFVMNAGVWSDMRELSPEMFNGLDWKKLLEDYTATIKTNILGFTRMATVAFEYFVQQKKGHFVGVSSVDAVRGNPNCPLYSGSKAFESTYMQGMRSLFESLGIDISVTDIRPGFIPTYGPLENAFWVEKIETVGPCIFNAVKKKKKIGYVCARWGLFAAYLQHAPDFLYNFVGDKFGIRSPNLTIEK